MIAAVILLAGGWLALSRNADPLAVAVALCAAVVAVALQRHIFPGTAPITWRILRRPHHLLLFVGTVGWRLICSTLYTCRVILTGKEEGRIVAVPTEIADPIGALLLSHSITLTPSTIALLLEGDLLYIHWLRARGDKGDWRGIKEALEHRLTRLLAEDRNDRR